MDINNEQFIALLRSALHYLYDPDQLRRSPLSGLFGLAERMDAPAELQKILLEAIEALKPGEDDPQHTRSWTAHEVLFFRYVRGYERQAVANQLGISDRQLSRDQRAALETLAQYLWKTYQLEGRQFNLPPESMLADGLAGRVETGPLPASPGGAVQVGSSWIEDLPAEKPVAWKLNLLSVLDLLRPLAAQHEVQMEYEPDEYLPDLLAPQTALRHALLNILGLMIPLAQQGRLVLEPQVSGLWLTIKATILTPSGDAPPPQGSLSSHPSLDVARRLVERAGGSLNLVEEGGRVEVNFTLPALAQIPVLVFDDNVDTILLFQRYVQGTRYSVIGASEPARFFQLIERIHPRILLLDVMMPEIDGWDVLSQLRVDQRIKDCAIIICSILPQEALARSLGADGFLQKPVLPQDFLQALDLHADEDSG